MNTFTTHTAHTPLEAAIHHSDITFTSLIQHGLIQPIYIIHTSFLAFRRLNTHFFHSFSVFSDGSIALLHLNIQKFDIK